MTLAELLHPDTRVPHPALRLGCLFPKDGEINRSKLVRPAFEQAASSRASINQAVHAEKRLKQLADDLAHDGVPVISLIATCATRLITGSGAGLPEVNATIVHPVYGYPYLPGSSLKGAARAEAARQQHPDLIPIFGGTPEADKEPGGIRFFDAVPTRTERELLELDVATVHHKDYYEHARPDIDPEPTQAPVPLPFLVVRAGVRFRFLLSGCSPLTPPGLVGSAFELLRTVFVEEGLGAGTATGYGYFDPDSVNVDVGRRLLEGN